nr:hypothetical protein B0A51_17404 [Rachicladosporium sp. CCFEE 5018]
MRLESLVNLCPLLDDLMVARSRLCGSLEEPALYSLLGRISGLKYLSLLLDCNNLDMYPPSDTEDEDEEGEDGYSDDGHDEGEDAREVMATGADVTSRKTDCMMSYGDARGGQPHPDDAYQASSASGALILHDHVLDMEPMSNVGSFGAEDVRTAMINAVVDEHLARSIFEAVFNTS